ncbi:sensor histidine kinase [Streptomyces chryseus]|uniref:histidine kinase n=3 Tax=Streptomyces chryseus TaxID=68186 RepID=A0ABQ3E1B8_9ACTN|nr:histidine kinase [Streptomyces chryseus]GGW97423.1 histidine kinase [Streptomyces chryseus]GHB16553.1 histidine kinase [Streptomyces chryseus]
MDVSSKIRAGRRWLAGPEPWPARRTAGECVLAAVLALLAAGTQELMGSAVLVQSATAVAVAVLSLLRRRLPATVLVVSGGAAGELAGFGPLLIVAGWSAGRRIPGAGKALAAFTASCVLNIVVAAASELPRFSPLSLIMFSTLYFLATTVVPGLASRYWTQRRTLLHALQEHNAQLLRERAMVAGQARLRERQRIAQDMHDSLGHQLALISVHTGALEVDPALTDRQREGVGVLRDASVAAMHELREVVGILRDGVERDEAATAPGLPPVEDPHPAARGAAGIEGLVAAARAAGNAVELRCAGSRRPLAAAADHAAYRIVQEALTNAYKHAPGAAINVELRYEPDSLVVEIANGPAPADPGDVVSGGQGLTGLRERARLVGGMVHAGRTDGGGFRVAGVLPYGADGLAPGTGAAPLVDVEDDFRQQSPAVPLGNGGQVMDWTVVQRELAMSGGRGSRSSGVVLGCGIAVAALVLLVVAGGFGLFFLAGSAERGMIEPSDYEAVKVGASEEEVRDSLPNGDSFMTSGLKDKGPARPEGSECLVLASSEFGESLAAEPVFRFCFRDGKLIEKKSYDVVQ